MLSASDFSAVRDLDEVLFSISWSLVAMGVPGLGTPGISRACSIDFLFEALRSFSRAGDVEMKRFEADAAVRDVLHGIRIEWSKADFESWT
jgi:hypothetical protein